MKYNALQNWIDSCSIVVQINFLILNFAGIVNWEFMTIVAPTIIGLFLVLAIEAFKPE